MREKGFSLLEMILSLTLFLVIILAGLEFFGMARSYFFKLKDAIERSLSANSAMDKMKIDILRAGEGLVQQMRLGAVEGVAVKDNKLVILKLEKEFALAEDLNSGQTRIPIATSSELKKGREICVSGANCGETIEIASVETTSVTLMTPLTNPYKKENSSLALLEKISIFLDGKDGTLRRKVNTSSAQPLLENVKYFIPAYENTANLVNLRFELMDGEGKSYEISVFPKNSGLALPR